MTFASGMTFWDAFAPGLALLAAAVAILPWLPRHNTFARVACLGIAIVFMWRYLAWRVVDTLPPIGMSPDFIGGVVFTALETLSIIGSTIALVFLTRTRNRSEEADRNASWLESLPQKPLVDVLICTYNEDQDILERTIAGAMAMDYPRYRLWVCDDGRRAWLKGVCEKFGCGYITRPNNAHAKAGNINHALQHLAGLDERPDFISILDADFVVRPNFLSRGMTLFRDHDVGIVQTPQHFFNADPIQTNLGVEKNWPDEQRFFFDEVMPSKDAWGGAFCCGTSSVIRYEPLMRIGGFPTDSVTEDYLVTIRLKEIGYSTVYLNEALSVGLAPEGLAEYVTQRSRWCLGFMQIFRGKSGPWRAGCRLGLLDRIMLWETFLYWSTAFAWRVMGLIVPILYLLLGLQLVHAQVTDAISHVFPYFISQIAVMMWLTRGRVLPLMSDLAQLLCAHEIIRAVIAGLFRPQGQKFAVTAKGGDRSKAFVQWGMLRGFLVYLILTITGVLWTFDFGGSGPLVDASAAALFWSWYNILVLLMACFASIEAERRKDERFVTDEMICITVPETGLQSWHRLRDISVGGVAVRGQFPGIADMPVNIRLGDLEVPARFLRSSNESFALRFNTGWEGKSRLTQHVYSGRYASGVTDVVPGRVFAGVLGRMLR